MAAIVPLPITPATVVSKLGTLAEVSDGGTLTINGNISIDIQSRGAIECKLGINKKGGNLNIIDVKEIKCKNGPLFKVTDSTITVTSVDTLKANAGAILEIEGKTSASKAIISQIKNLSSSRTSVKTEGKCKVLLDNIGAITCEDPLFLLASSSTAVTSVIGGGSVTVQNINYIPSGIKVYDHDLSIKNVKSINSTSKGIDFTSVVSPKNKTGVYTLSVSNVGSVRGSSYAIKASSAAVNLKGVYLVGVGSFTESDVQATSCIFGDKLELTDSFFEGRRVQTLAVETLKSSVKFYNSSISGVFTTTKSAVESYNSTFVASTHTSSSVNVHKSSLAGATTLNTGSNLMSFSSDLANITNNNSYAGIYGLPSGTVTTTGNGMTFAGGTSGQSIDGKSISNGISTPASTLYLVANELDVTTIAAAKMTVGTTYDLITTGNAKLDIGGNLTFDVTGSITQTGTTVDWTQTGAINISSASTVTITGTTVTV